jgi:hypothetical protein
MNKKLCDICTREIKEIEPKFIIIFQSSIINANNDDLKDICFICACKKLDIKKLYKDNENFKKLVPIDTKV